MAPNNYAAVKERVLSLDFKNRVSVRLRPLFKNKIRRQHRRHGILFFIDRQAPAEIDQPAALGIDRQSAVNCSLERAAEAYISRKFGSLCFRESSPDVEAVYFRQRRVLERIDLQKLRALLFQRLKIIGIIELK